MSLKERIVSLISESRCKPPCELDFRFDEPMSAHTTFRVGGPADCWMRPAGRSFPVFCTALLTRAKAAGIPVFVLGGGANIVAADKGIRGITLDTSFWSGLRGPFCGPNDRSRGRRKGVGTLRLYSGTTMDEAAEIAANAGLSGLEFLAGMPGSIGGGIWMNARCYEREMADVLVETEVFFTDQGKILNVPLDRSAFGYKRSPFQNCSCLILSAVFRLEPGDQAEIRLKMKQYRKERESKGHYRYPCAGSVFKNNRDFGKPAGKIIDELGLRGLREGGAQVAPFHGNIIVNRGGAAAADIRALTLEVAVRVKAAAGFTLEPEILFVGDW